MKPNQVLDEEPEFYNLDEESLRWYWVRAKYFFIAGCAFLSPSGLIMAIFNPQEATVFFNLAGLDTTRNIIIGSFGLGALLAIVGIVFFVLYQYKKNNFKK